MKWLILLLQVLGVTQLARGESQQELADRIVSTEKECGRLYQLNENWNSDSYNDQAVLYVDLYFICQDNLAEAKYSYIEANHLNMTNYPAPDAKFPVMTTNGEVWVSKPPVRSKEDMSAMQEKLDDFMDKFVSQDNPMFKLVDIQSGLSQEIVDQQVTCELMGVKVLKNPKLQTLTEQHTSCMDKLNCLKEKFMAQHGFTLSKYQDFFPILYKGKGTMLNSPPRSDGTSLCIRPVHPAIYKMDLNHLHNIKGKLENAGKIAGEKIQDARAKIVKKLQRFNKKDSGHVLTEKEMDEIMNQMESITLLDSNEDTKHSSDNLLKKYGGNMIDKLAELEAKSMDTFYNGKSEIMNEIKPYVAPIDHVASKLGNNLQKIENSKVKPYVKKTMKGLSDAESQVKAKYGDAIDEATDKMTLAGNTAAKIIKKDGSRLLNNLKHKVYQTAEAAKGNAEEGWVNEFSNKLANNVRLQKSFDQMGKTLQNKMAQMGIQEGEDGIHIDEGSVNAMLNTLKQDVKKRAKDLQISKGEMKQAAVVIKSVLHTVLDAAKSGYGPAKSMNNDEIDEAKSVINEIVDFATKGVLEEDEDNEHLLEAPPQSSNPNYHMKKPTTETEEHKAVEDESQMEDKTASPTTAQQQLPKDTKATDNTEVQDNAKAPDNTNV